MTPLKDRPVLAGLLALVGVGSVVGLLLGLGTLAGTQALGLGGASGDTTATDAQSMYLPKPKRTQAPTGPLITLLPDGSTKKSEPRPSPTQSSPQFEITLSAAQPTVSSMQQIDLSGSYPAGEGAVLQVQRFANGGWMDFPVTVSVSGGAFSTYVQTGQTGVNRFRVVDTNTGKASNEVKITVT